MHPPPVRDRVRNRRLPLPLAWPAAGARVGVTAVALVAVAALGANVMVADGWPGSGGGAPVSTATPSGQVVAGGAPGTRVDPVSPGVDAVPVTPVPLPVPDVLEPGTTTSVLVPDIPADADSVLLDLTVTQLPRAEAGCASGPCPGTAPVEPRSGHASGVEVRLTGPDRDEVVLVAGSEPIAVRAWAQGFDVLAAEEGVEQDATIAGSVDVHTEVLEFIDCDIILDASPTAPEPAPTPAPPPAPAPPAPSPDAPGTADPSRPLSPKKGVASYAYWSSDIGKLTALRTSWAYNWSTNVPTQTGGLEFVPMAWGPGSVTDASIRDLREGGRAGRFSTLLGFNEPDLHDQSNMSVEEALALWPTLESTGLRLVSPAPTSPWNGWLDQFMTRAADRGHRVDAVALHYYQDFTDPQAVQRLEGELREVHRRYGRPIWITEIGAFDLRAWGLPMSAEPTHERADAYMRDVLALLESLPFVERYAWFDDNCWALPECRYSSLYDDRGAITSHGRTYTAATTPAPSPSAGDPRSLKVSGTVLRDAGGTGDVVDLRGTNLGGWLLQEGWMSPAGEAPLDRTGWSASADATEWGDWPARALDGDPGTRWSSGREQTVGQTFTVDLGAARTFDEVSFDAGASIGDVPPGSVVRASDDGRSWRDIGSGRGTGQRTTVHTDHQTARYLQVAITAADPGRRWWSISEFHAYVSDEYNTRRVLADRFGGAAADSLIAGYQDAWLQASDLDAIQGLGLNMVRVPIDWQVLMRPDGTMRPDSDAFRKLDWLVAEAGRRGIYVVLDLHGAPGGACPWHSCGRAGSNALWSDPVQQERTVRIWQRIAARYAGNPSVAAYDLLNEPLVTSGQAESAQQTRQKFDLYDRLYDAVRAVDPDHVIVVAAFYSWENALPPSAYGWTNVVYQTHHYRFSAGGDHAAMRQFVDEELTRLSHHRALWQVPVYAGEFWLGEFDDLYSRWLSGLNGMHASWSTWTYKVRGGGHWGLFQDNASPVPDLARDTQETIGAKWSRFGTSGFVPNTRLQDVLRAAAAPRATPTVPVTIRAEGYVEMAGLLSEATTDGGGANLGWTDPGDFAEYDVVAPSAGTYRVTLRVASPGGAPGALRVVSATSSSPVSVPATGGWQSWTDVTTTVRLGAGEQRIRLQVDGPAWNVNWLRIAPV